MSECGSDGDPDHDVQGAALDHRQPWWFNLPSDRWHTPVFLMCRFRLKDLSVSYWEARLISRLSLFVKEVLDEEQWLTILNNPPLMERPPVPLSLSSLLFPLTLPTNSSVRSRGILPNLNYWIVGVRNIRAWGYQGGLGTPKAACLIPCRKFLPREKLRKSCEKSENFRKFPRLTVCSLAHTLLVLGSWAQKHSISEEKSVCVFA